MELIRRRPFASLRAKTTPAVRRRAIVSTGIVAMMVVSSLGPVDTKQRYKSESTIESVVFHGADAAQFVQKLVRENDKSRQIHESLVGRGLLPRVVFQQRTIRRAVPVARAGVWGFIDRMVNAEVHAQEWSQDGVTLVWSAWEDGNSDTAEGNMWFIIDGGIQYAHDLSVHTPNTYYDPPNANYPLGGDEGYDDYDYYYPHGWHTMSGRYWDGISCDDRFSIVRRQNQLAQGHLVSAYQAMPLTAFACIGFTLGWGACFFGGSMGYIATRVLWDKASYLTSCHG